jgi:hypothetical protein
MAETNFPDVPSLEGVPEEAVAAFEATLGIAVGIAPPVIGPLSEFETESSIQEPPAPPVYIVQSTSQGLAEKIARETCILEIHRHEPGFEKKIDSSIILQSAEDPGIADIDPKRLSVTKALVDRKEIKALASHRQKFFDGLKALSLPGGMLTLGNGQYLIAISMITDVKGRIDTYLSERSALLDDFEARYPEIIEKAKERLGSLFNHADYPPFPVLRSLYNTTYKFLSNTVPEEIEKVSREIYEAEQSRILAQCEAEISLIQTTLRERFLDLNNHFLERLGTDEKTGKPKRFHGSNIEHLKDFCQTFQHMNLTGDVVLEDLVKKTEALLDGMEPGKVRSDAEFRAELEKGFNEIKAAADLLVVERKRKVILED